MKLSRWFSELPATLDERFPLEDGGVLLRGWVDMAQAG